MVEQLSNGMGDLPADILESQPEYLKLSNESIAQEAPDLDRVLEESWGKRKDGQTALIPNSEYRTGVQVPPRDTVDVKKQKAETIRVARWMIMHNEPISKIQQHLENSIDSGLINRAEASVILADRPFLGQLYLDRNIAATCSDIRKASQHPAAKNTLWLVTSECCRACAKDRFCVESGKQLLGSAPVGKRELVAACQHMMKCGRVFSDAKVETWEDLRQAMLPQDHEIKPRTYSHFPAVVQVPEALSREAITGFLKTSAEKRQENENQQKQIETREVLKICRVIYGSIMEGHNGDILKAQMQKLGIPTEILSRYLPVFKKLANDPLLLSRTVSLPEVFEDCRKHQELLRANQRPKYLRAFAKCYDCNNNINEICHLLGSKILKTGEKVPVDDLCEKIDELQSRKLITSAQAAAFKEMERHQYLSGLQAAIKASREHEKHPENNHITTQQSSHQDLPDDVLGTSTGQDLKYRIAEAPEPEEGQWVKSFFADSNNDIIMDTPAAKESLKIDLGNPGAAMVVETECLQQPLTEKIFRGAGEMEVQVDSRFKREHPLDIQGLVAASDLSVFVDVDLGKNDSTGITNYEQLYDFLPADFTRSARDGASSLEIEDLGGGLDLSGIL